MFDVSIFEIVAATTGGIIALLFLVTIINAWRNEKNDAEYLRGSLSDWRRSSWEQTDLLLDEQRRGRVRQADVSRLELDLADALARAGEADELMGEASALIHAFIVELDEADEDLADADEDLANAEEDLANARHIYRPTGVVVNNRCCRCEEKI